jgi:hypothetical protein
VQDGPDRISITAIDNYIAEGSEKPGSVVIRREGSRNVDRLVKLNITGSAVNGEDCEFIPSEILVPAGQTQVIIPIFAYEDYLVEPTEFVEIVVLAGEGYTVVSPASAKVAIGTTELEPGDINGKNGVTLADALLALQISVGMTPYGNIFFDAEIGNDRRIDVIDAIGILQILAQDTTDGRSEERVEPAPDPADTVKTLTEPPPPTVYAFEHSSAQTEHVPDRDFKPGPDPALYE